MNLNNNNNNRNEIINKLIVSSKRVIRDCSLNNGAFVASNSNKKYFPKLAKNYYFVWPRDAMYSFIAADILNITNIQEPFFNWCINAEGFKDTGLFYEKYNVDGTKARHNLQPDQTASVIIAIYNYFVLNKNKKIPKEIIYLLKKTADGLSKIWKKDHFNVVVQDLWEERFCFPDVKENFSYSLSICSKALDCADKIILNKSWKKTSLEMKEIFLKYNFDYYHRSFGKINDKRVDASLLGLVFPSDMICANNKIMIKTIKKIKKEIVKNYGVYRYENDDYDGWMYNNMNRKKGAGYWPLLNFWMSIYYLDLGNRKEALKYYNKVIDDLDNLFIPEQIFDNKIQVSVSPLCWSHSMFIIASKKLGFI
jgi:GH15 family glucan-1,4-alpha-glucosidase